MKKNGERQQALLEQSGFTYFAFISYRRTDARWAAWLKQRLQLYRLPQRTHKKHQELPPRFHSVFLDKTNLTPGLLDEGLRAEVQASKYLIVVCSRSAKEKSQYLDAEIQYFLDGGGTPDRIIPFIVDNAPMPEETCFPRRLQELCREQTILGANIYDSGKRNAFLKVIAHMHGLKLEEIESDDLRRRRKTAMLAALICILVIAGLCYGGYRYWDYHREKTVYYLDYTERYGIPEGLGLLPEGEQDATACRYVFVYRENKVRELRYENAHGRLIAHTGATDHDRPVRAVYEYAEDDALDRVTWYDTEGELALVWNYVNRNTVDLQYDQTDNYSSGAVLRAQNPLVDAGGRPDPSMQNVCRYLLDYDENCYLTELRYVSNPVYNDAASDADGIGGMRYERDAQGRLTRLWYLTYVGARGSAGYAEDYQVLGLSNGVSGMGFLYNEDGQLSEYRYLDSDGKPIRNSRGFALARLSYDEHSNLTETRYYDTEQAPVRQKGGYAVYSLTYDAHGDRVSTRFTGTDGQPALNEDGYASATFSYDPHGNMVEASFFDPDGQPTLTSDGYAILRMAYDEKDRLIRQSSFGTDGESIVALNGCAAQTWSYDAEGRLSQTAFFGTDGKPCRNAEGCAEKRMTFDAQGRCDRVSVYDVDGSPCTSRYGYSSVVLQYDSHGNTDQLRYYDPSGAAVCCADGYAVWRQTLDEHGNPISERYFGTREEPVCSVDGYAAVERQFDDNGHLLQARYLGMDGELILLPAGYAMMQGSFDRRGNLTEIRYFGTDGAPCLTAEGYASSRARYDERGNLTRIEYFGKDGTPVLRSGGYSAAAFVYNRNGQLTEERFFGPDGALTLCLGGYACANYEYDASGRRTAELYLDTEENPVTCASGYAFCRIFYDENGPIQADFYDPAGNYLGSQTDFGD